MSYTAIVTNNDEWRAKNRHSVLPPFRKRRSQTEAKCPRPVTNVLEDAVGDLETASPLLRYQDMKLDRQQSVDEKSLVSHINVSNRKPSIQIQVIEVPLPQGKPEQPNPRAPIPAKDWKPTTKCEPRAEAYNNLTANERRPVSEKKVVKKTEKTWKAVTKDVAKTVLKGTAVGIVRMCGCVGGGTMVYTFPDYTPEPKKEMKQEKHDSGIDMSPDRVPARQPTVRRANLPTQVW